MLKANLPPILASAGLLMGANGMMLTLVAVRAADEGFSEAAIGLMGTAYYAGLFTACLTTPLLIRRAGHIRVFAAMCALVAADILVMVLIFDQILWIALRYLAGFCLSGVVMVIESWLNELASQGNRARVTSLYRVVELGAVTGAQFLLPIVGTGGFHIFALTAIIACVALVPVSLSRLRDPPAPDDVRVHASFIWQLSPVACVGCLTIGLTNGAFRSVGPVYAQSSGLDVEGVALFMGLAILAGALFQFPLGWLSDRLDRRFTLLLATSGAVFACLLMIGTSGISPDMQLIGGFLFGGFAMPLYALSAAHANDLAPRGRFVELAAGLTLCFAAGAIVGPSLAAFSIETFGPEGFFGYIATMHSLLVAFILYRFLVRRRSPSERGRFIALPRTSPFIFRLFHGDQPKDQEDVTRDA